MVINEEWLKLFRWVVETESNERLSITGGVSVSRAELLRLIDDVIKLKKQLRYMQPLALTAYEVCTQERLKPLASLLLNAEVDALLPAEKTEIETLLKSMPRPASKS